MSQSRPTLGLFSPKDCLDTCPTVSNSGCIMHQHEPEINQKSRIQTFQDRNTEYTSLELCCRTTHVSLSVGHNNQPKNSGSGSIYLEFAVLGCPLEKVKDSIVIRQSTRNGTTISACNLVLSLCKLSR